MTVQNGIVRTRDIVLCKKIACAHFLERCEPRFWKDCQGKGFFLEKFLSRSSRTLNLEPLHTPFGVMEGSLDRLVSSEAALDPSTVTFKQETVQKLFSRHWDAKTKGQLLIKEPLQTAPFNTFTTGIMPSRSLTTSQSLDSAINLDMGTGVKSFPCPSSF